METKVRSHVIIDGKVQGVFFRMETQRAANKFGVSGWVRNLPNGTVEAVFEGEHSRVDQILKWCETGPSLSDVKRVDVTWESYAGEYEGFEITY